MPVFFLHLPVCDHRFFPFLKNLPNSLKADSVPFNRGIDKDDFARYKYIMKNFKLSDVFAAHAGTLMEQARNGLPFTVLVSGSEDLPKSFATKQEADRELDRLPGGAVAEINPNATDQRLACTLYIHPTITWGSFER